MIALLAPVYPAWYLQRGEKEIEALERFARARAVAVQTYEDAAVDLDESHSELYAGVVNPDEPTGMWSLYATGNRQWQVELTLREPVELHELGVLDDYIAWDRRYDGLALYYHDRENDGYVYEFRVTVPQEAARG